MPGVALLITGCTDTQVFRRPPTPVVVAGVASTPAVLGPVVPAAATETESAPEPPAYRIGCPDVLEVSFAEHPQLDVLAAVDVDGELPLGYFGRVRVDGLSESKAAEAVAVVSRSELSNVRVRVVDPRSARVFVCGPENGKQRPVPYRGPERVLDFLWRVGAVKRGCSDLGDVYVIRSNVASGGKPQILRVDVLAVVLDGNAETNVLLQPSDQVYIGETRRSVFSRLVPEWLQPLYRKIVGLFPTPILRW